MFRQSEYYLILALLTGACGCGDSLDAQLNQTWDLLCEKDQECPGDREPEDITPLETCIAAHQACNYLLEAECGAAISKYVKCITALPCTDIFSDPSCSDEYQAVDEICPDPDDNPALRFLEVEPECPEEPQ